jgi:hypothetical protein
MLQDTPLQNIQFESHQSRIPHRRLLVFACETSALPRNLLPPSGVQFSVRSNLAKSFVAVISGNAIYFILLMPLLPAAAQHRPKRLDLGLLFDFWVCLVCYGVVEIISRVQARHRS